MSRHAATAILACVAWGLAKASLPAQTPPARQTLTQETIANLIATARPDTRATLTIANREIVVLRASILGRSAVERAQVIRATVLDHLDAAGSVDVSSRPLGAAAVISVGGRDAFAILSADTDELNRRNRGDHGRAGGQPSPSRAGRGDGSEAPRPDHVAAL